MEQVERDICEMQHQHRFHIRSCHKSVTCVVKDGELLIDGVCHHVVPRCDLPSKTDDEIAYEIISHLHPFVIKRVVLSSFVPHITGRLRAYMRAVEHCEKCVLNPHTLLGRRRIEKEFELVIADDSI